MGDVLLMCNGSVGEAPPVRCCCSSTITRGVQHLWGSAGAGPRQGAAMGKGRWVGAGLAAVG